MHVTFIPSLKEVSVEKGRTVLDAAREAGVYIDSQCNGGGKCGKCRIRIIKGKVSRFAKGESQFLSHLDRELGYRLACLAKIEGNTTILIPGEHVLESSEAKKVFSGRSGVLDPAVKGYRLDLSEDTSPGRAHFERATGLLAAKNGLESLHADLFVLRDLVKAVEEGEGRITVFVWMDREIIGVFPGQDETAFGLALDVGTTTVALYLCDLKNGDVVASASVTNPQVLFGADIMSRIAYSSDHPVVGARTMQGELIHAVNTLIDQTATANNLSPKRMMDMTVVGNTVMHHIFLGIPPDQLGLWPFSPSVQGSVDVKARDIGLIMNPSANVYVLPVQAGFVGADNVGVLLSAEPQGTDDLSLVVDLGTNGEIVLGNRERLMSCSCATGPAFEGAQISSGMRATAGAMERVRIDSATLDPDYAVVGKKGWASEHPLGELRPVGICGSGIIDAVAHLYKTGVIKKNGVFSEGLDTPRVKKVKGITEFVLAWGEETATGADIVLTQKDIRQIQLAKAALFGGCRVLMSHFRISSINRIIVAGAFGMHIDKENALAIGLLPWCEPDNIVMVGNAAGHGAYLTLVDRAKRTEADRIARWVNHIELALEPEFQKEFLKSLSFPDRGRIDGPITGSSRPSESQRE